MSSQFSIGKYEFKEEQNIKWLKVFYHNNVNGEFFSDNFTEFLDSNSPQKFSILGQINSKMRFDGKFEFLLEYPEDSISNHWRQSNNPVYDYEVVGNGKYNVSGYEPINITATQNSWGGLIRSSAYLSTYIDGSVGVSEWYYAIGQRVSSWNSGKIAGYKSVNEVKLWIRITDTSFDFSPLVCYCSFHGVKFIHYIILLASHTFIS